MYYDVAIIGGGVVGAMTARELSRYALSVCLLEKENDVAMGASRANSGILHGGYDPKPGTLKAKLNVEGLPLVYEAARELNVPYQNCGSLVCSFGAEGEDAAIDALHARGVQNGLDCLRILSGSEARALEPGLSEKVTRALLVPNAGIVCPYELTLAATENALHNGVTLKRNFEVCAIEAGEKFTVTAASGERIQCGYLVNCAGGYSDKIAVLAGDGFFEIQPRAGEYLLLDKAEGRRVTHTIFQVPTAAGKGILVTPTVDGNLLTGPTAVPVAAPDSTETTADGLQAVAALAAKSVPGVNFRQVITSFAGVRSSEKHGDFIIQASERVKNLVHVAAIDSPGLTSCVAIAKMAVSILHTLGAPSERKPDWDGTRADPHAFRKLSDEEKDAYIRLHPAYGRIVCRCETVSEGEILDALRREPRALDLDGVKRRTRSGMGRCQGGFCSPHILGLLAKELGIPMEQVTKSGSGSNLLTGRL